MLQQIDTIRTKVEEVYKYLHSHPEISWEELETTDYVKRQLIAAGYRVHVIGEFPGLIAEIGHGSPIVGLRADMDALWQEVDGRMQANHSCGHDAHMTMVLGAAMLLAEMKDQLEGTVRLIFQPAEETGQGALGMVEQGAADNLDFLYGVHLRPQSECENGKAASSIRHGAGFFIEGEIDGEDAHGARPHLGTSAITVGFDLARKLDGIRLAGFVPFSVKMTQFKTHGENPNIIAGKATFHLDLRAQTNELMDALIKEVYGITERLGVYYGIPIILKERSRAVAAKVDPEAEHYMKQAIIETIGRSNQIGPLVTTGGDDFHYYTLKRPHLKATMLGLGCGLEPGLHHPDMAFDHSALFTGIQILTKAVQNTLRGESHQN
ncbi:MAG: M20 peptidase aminoacylase family protein [Tuberibacillus sp.]